MTDSAQEDREIPASILLIGVIFAVGLVYGIEGVLQLTAPRPLSLDRHVALAAESETERVNKFETAPVGN